MCEIQAHIESFRVYPVLEYRGCNGGVADATVHDTMATSYGVTREGGLSQVEASYYAACESVSVAPCATNFLRYFAVVYVRSPHHD